jgi:hypothetical protein
VRARPVIGPPGEAAILGLLVVAQAEKDRLAQERSLVHSVNCTWATRRGSIHVTSLMRGAST